jgi:hypothetical protein
MDVTFRKTQARYRRRRCVYAADVALILRELVGMSGLIVSSAALSVLLSRLIGPI